ncbi:hypothetical protein ABPG74_020356 [Tetrahymena malaccensis]
MNVEKAENKPNLIDQTNRGQDLCIQNYLSSDFESGDDLNNKKEYIEVNKSVFKQPCLFFSTFIIQYMIYFIYILFVPAYIFTEMFLELTLNFFKERMWAMLSLWSIAYSIIIFFFTSFKSQEFQVLIFDEIFFIFTTFLVFSYMRAVDIQNQNGFIEQLKRTTSIKENIYQLVYFHMPFDSRAVQLDYNQVVEFKREPFFPTVSTFYSLMSVKKNIQPAQKHISDMIENFNKYLIPNFQHFYILLLILTLKLGSILLYIYLKQGFKQIESVFDFIMIFFVYIYVSFNLNRVLGNNDLRKKILQMQRFNDLIDYENINQNNYKEKLDITSPVNFETWEVARKFILDYKKEYLEVLEVSYFAFLFYYFFVIIICLSAYFDLYWLIPKESHLLKPASVIINTFNFVFLNAIFILRLNVGTEYNYSFEKLLSSISFLQVMISNLSTMYPQFFLQDQMSDNKEDRYSAYALIVKKIKQLSTNIIQTKSFYYKKVYSFEEKHELRRQIIQNIQITLKKAKESVILDRTRHSYKFANMMEINKNDFIFTLFIGIASTLPKILPILILFYIK